MEALWGSVCVSIAVTNIMIKSSLEEKVLPYMFQVHNPLRDVSHNHRGHSAYWLYSKLLYCFLTLLIW